LGAKVEQSAKIPKHALPSYGYRKLDPAIVMKLLREASEENERPSNAIESILGSLEPTAPVEGASYAEGPFVFTNQRILGISDAQRKLDERLTFGIKNLMRDRYPGYG
jgi:hypothetical protein